MKKNVLLVATLLPLFAMAQVGINTPQPTATLDVTAKNATGNSTNVDGLLVPRVDRQRAQSMTNIPTSTLIYVNSIATGTAAGTAAHIDAVGYYSFDGTVWTKFSGGGSGSDVHLYNSDGELTGDRTVTQGTNALAFTSTATTGINHFSIDGNTFSINAVENNVGISTTTPRHKLDFGTSAGSSITDVAGKKLALFSNGTRFYGLGISGNTLQFHANSTFDQAPSMVLMNTGNVGIGTTDPAAKLDIAGNIKIADGTQGAGKVLTSNADGVATWQTPSATASQNIYNNNGTLTGNRIVTMGTNFLAFNTEAQNGFSVAKPGTGYILSVDGQNSRVGIGTTAPAAKLDVAGNIKIADGTQGAGKVLTSNAAGVATWQTPSATGSQNIYNNNGTLTGARTVAQGANTLAFTGTAANAFSVDGATFSVDAANNRVGIGTTAPTTNLHVVGGARITNIPNALAGDQQVYVDANGVLKKLAASTAVRTLWGVVRPNANGTVTIINSGSGGWTATRNARGTIMIRANTSFSTVPTAHVQQYLNQYNSVTNSGIFPQAASQDNTGVDGVSLNQFQIWSSDNTFNRVDSWPIAFTINGY